MRKRILAFLFAISIFSPFLLSLEITVQDTDVHSIEEDLICAARNLNINVLKAIVTTDDGKAILKNVGNKLLDILILSTPRIVLHL